MNEVTRILSECDPGDPRAAERLLPLVYDELRRLAAARLANERADHTLDATALVHKAYLRLVGSQQFEGRAHFFAAAAEAMRRVLVDHSPNRARLKRGGDTLFLVFGLIGVSRASSLSSCHNDYGSTGNDVHRSP
jgi:RNA polymerase sigma factor (TIGR02999 family)